MSAGLTINRIAPLCPSVSPTADAAMLCAAALILLGREAAGQSDAREVFFVWPLVSKCPSRPVLEFFDGGTSAYPGFRLGAWQSEGRPLQAAGKCLAPA